MAYDYKEENWDGLSMRPSNRNIEFLSYKICFNVFDKNTIFLLDGLIIYLKPFHLTFSLQREKIIEIQSAKVSRKMVNWTH